jgi:hypothetical protein
MFYKTSGELRGHFRNLMGTSSWKTVGKGKLKKIMNKN